MEQKDKELLLQGLCTSLPYKTYVKTANGMGYIYAINTSQLIELSVANDSEYWSDVFNIDEIKPYLRPMSSMIEEEYEEYAELRQDISDKLKDWKCANLIDWLNAHHFDYRGLIEKGLAIKASEGMYI